MIRHRSLRERRAARRRANIARDVVFFIGITTTMLLPAIFAGYAYAKFTGAI